MIKRYEFSAEQKRPFILGCIILGLCIVLFVLGGFELILLNLIRYGFPLILSIVMISIGSLAMHKVAIDEDGISVVTKRGRKLRYIAWNDIKIYDIDPDVDRNPIKYMYFSSNECYNIFKKRTFGGLWDMAKDKSIIIVPADRTLISNANIQLKKHGFLLSTSMENIDDRTNDESEQIIENNEETENEIIDESIILQRKYPFSSEQKTVFYIGLIDFIFFLIVGVLCLLNISDETTYIVMVPVLVFVLVGVYVMIMSAVTLKAVILEKDGMAVVNKKGKEIFRINWDEVKKVSVSSKSLYGGVQYLVVSTNNKVVPYKASYMGGVGEMFTKKKTIIVPCDLYMISYCSRQMKKRGIRMQDYRDRL